MYYYKVCQLMNLMLFSSLSKLACFVGNPDCTSNQLYQYSVALYFQELPVTLRGGAIERFPEEVISKRL